MSIAEFYLDISRLGVRLSIENEVLRVHSPAGLPADISAELRRRHQELDAFVRRLLGLVSDSKNLISSRSFSGALTGIKFDRTCLVPIRSGDLSCALFFTHALSGMVAPAEMLSRLLPSEQAVFGFQALGLTPRNEALRSVEEMAAHYLLQVRLVD